MSLLLQSEFRETVSIIERSLPLDMLDLKIALYVAFEKVDRGSSQPLSQPSLFQIHYSRMGSPRVFLVIPFVLSMQNH